MNAIDAQAISCARRLKFSFSMWLPSMKVHHARVAPRVQVNGTAERMVAVSDFSGLESSPCALARAAAMAPMVSLERCIGSLPEIEVDGAGFRAFGLETMAGGLPGVLRHQFLQAGLGLLMFLVRGPGPPIAGGKFGPAVGAAHVDDLDGFQPGPWRLDAKQFWGVAVLDTAPELLLRGDQKMLVQRIGMDRDLDPLATAGDDRQHRSAGIGDKHIVLQLRHMLFGRALFRER